MNDDPSRGQIWERRNGTRFVIENIIGDYAYYWLSAGSKPQHRTIRLDLLIKNYRRYK